MATQTIFGTEVPAVLDAADGSTSYSMGTRFRPQVDGTVSKIRWYFPATTPSSTVQVQAGLYRMLDSVLLGSTVFPLSSSPGWQEVALPTPLSVIAGTLYQTVIWTPSRYVATSGYSWPKTSGDLVTETPGGYFKESPNLDIPNSNFNNGNYFVDVVFTPAGSGPSGPTLTVWDGASEKAVGSVKVWNGTTELEVGSIEIV